MAGNEIDRKVTSAEEDKSESGSEITEVAEDEKKSGPDHPVDTGWAWVVLGGCVFQILIYGGVMRSFGVFFLQYQMRFNSNASETAIMNLIQNVLISVSALFIMTVGLQKFTPRTAVFAGGILTWLSFFITAFIKDIKLFYLVQGALSGVGIALMHPPILVIIGCYFNKHRGLANSIFMGGASVGGLMFAPVIVNLFEEYKYEGAMLIISAILLNICVGACLMTPTSFYAKKKKDKHNEQLNPENAEEMKLLKTGTSDVVSSNGDHASEGSNPHLKSSVYSVGSHGDYAGHHQKKDFRRMQSYDPSTRKPQGSPLLHRIKAHSYDKIHIRHRTQSEGPYQGDHEMHGSKGKLNHVIDAISRSQRNMCASDGMFGSLVDIYQPMAENELPNGAHQDKHNEADESETNRGCCNPIKKCFLSVLCTMFDMQLLRDPVFIVFLFMAFMFIAGVALAPAYLPPLANEIGISNDNIAVLVALISAIDFVSKISVAYIADRGWIKRSTILVIVAVVFGTASHLTVFIKSFPAMIVFAVAMGLCCGQYTSMYAVVLQDVTGPEKFGKSLGFGTLVHGTSVAIFFPIAGLIRDVTKTYVSTFHLFGGLAYVAGILVLVISRVTKRQLAREKKQKDASPS